MDGAGAGPDLLAWVVAHAGLLAALLVAGVVAGVLAGLLGIGGGGVLVPVLYEIFGILEVDPSVQMHVALGTTMAIIAPTTLRSFASHHAKGSVDMQLWRRFAPWVVLGVVGGIVMASTSTGTVLKWVWIVASAVVAMKLAAGKEEWQLGADVPKRPWFEAAFLSFGWLSTLMSIGGGTFVVPYLTLYGRKILTAVSTAAAFGPLVAVPGVVGYIWAGWGQQLLPPFSLGYVCVAAALVVAPVSVFAAPFGVRLAHGIERRTLELAFAAFLAVVCIRFLMTV
ncbi:MAG: sulfite exporter TauE/SafE family protein [Alphaproteobacteria bacterium]|nr:sulfite exporter TauE/SafE family protein [Alphaproteobacteria bacterium]